MKREENRKLVGRSVSFTLPFLLLSTFPIQGVGRVEAWHITREAFGNTLQSQEFRINPSLYACVSQNQNSLVESVYKCMFPVDVRTDPHDMVGKITGIT